MADTQINVGMNVDGVITGTEKAKRSLKDLGGAASEAGKSVGGMGDGGKQSADKVEQSTRSMINSIQRQIAATEAGDKSTRAYQESLARMRGIDAGALKPYLDQLDAAKSKAQLAGVANESFAASFNGIRNAALIAAAAIGSFGMAFKKINDGVDALNDLKDATGASIENISALEDVALRSGASFDTVSTSLIKFNGILKDAKPGSDAANAMRALGLSVEDFKRLDPAEALRQTAVAMNSFADDGNKARIAQELFGKSLKDVAPFLKDLADQGALVAKVTTQQAEEAEKFNKELFQMGKNAQDLAREFTGPMVTAINEVILKFKEGRAAGRGFFSVGWQNYKDGIADFYGVKKSESGATGSWENGATGSWGEADKPSAPQLPDTAALKAGAAAAAKAAAEANRELKEQAKLLAELSGLTGSFSEDWDRLSTIYKNGKLSLDGLTKAQADLLSKQPAIKAARDAEAKSLEAITKAYQESEKEHARYIDGLGKGLDKLTADTKAQQDRNDRLGLSKEAIADLDAAELQLQATKLDGLAIDQLVSAHDEIAYAALKAQADEKRKLAILMQQGATKEAGIEAAKKVADEWKKGWEETDKIARDAFVGWAEGGIDMAEAIGKSLKKALLSAIYEATIKPIALSLYTSVAGSAANASTGSAGGVGGVASALGAISGLKTAIGGAGWITNFGGNVAASASSLGSSIGGDLGAEMMMNSEVIGATAKTFGDVLGYANAAYALSQGKYGEAAGAAIGTYFGGPIGSFIGGEIGKAVDSLFGGETRSGAAYDTVGGKAHYQQGPSGGEIAGDSARKMFDSAQASINSTLKAVGSAATLTGFTAGLESSDNGKGFEFAGGYINGKGFGEYSGREGDKNGQFALHSQDSKQAFTDYGTQLSQSIVEALLIADDIPKTVVNGIRAALDGGSVSDLSADATAALLKSINDVVITVNSFNEAAKTLPFEYLKNLSFDAAAGLIAAAGGMENLGASLANYYDAFYSDTEKRDLLIKNTTASFDKLGMTMPALDEKARDWYRSEVDRIGAMDMSVAANASAYTSVLSLSGAMNTLVPAAKEAAKAIEDAAKSLIDTVSKSSSSALTALEKSVEAQSKIYTLARDVAVEQVTAITSVFDSLKTNVDALYGQVSGASAMQAAQGNAFITQALSAAQATGYLPDSADLSDAITAARAGADSAVYASQQDADFARLVLAGKLSALKDISGDQLTESQKTLAAAQSQVDYLDRILSDAKLQLDAVNGIGSGVMSLVDAMTNMNANIAALFAERTGQGLASSAGTGVVVGGGGVMSGPDAMARLGTIKGYVQGLNWGTPEADNASAIALAQAAISTGVTQREIASAMGMPLASIEALFSKAGIPAFAVGTNYVPNDMLAQIHEGEAIIPKAYNPAANGGNNQRLESLVEGLTKEVQRLQSIVDDGNKHARRTADAVNGNSEMPMIVEAV